MTYIEVSFFLAIIGFSNMPLVFEDQFINRQAVARKT